MNARTIFIAMTFGLTTLGLAAGPAFAAEPIEGTWKRDNGTLIRFANCGGTKFCGTVMTGKYKGQAIGAMSGAGGSYKGTIKVLDEGKTYNGKASVTGNSMKMSGCVLGGLICKGETMARQ